MLDFVGSEKLSLVDFWFLQHPGNSILVRLSEDLVSVGKFLVPHLHHENANEVNCK